MVQWEDSTRALSGFWSQTKWHFEVESWRLSEDNWRLCKLRRPTKDWKLEEARFDSTDGILRSDQAQDPGHLDLASKVITK